jgi:hypothetical protein
MAILMLSGEREAVRLKPSLLSNPWLHVAALLLAGWSLVLLALFTSKSWLETEVVWWKPWTWFVANDVAAHLWAAVGPVLVGLAYGLLGKKRAGLLVGCGSAVLASLLSLLEGQPPPPATQVLPLNYALLALVLLLFAELRRRSQHLVLTNLRLVSWQGFPVRRQWIARHADLVELELRQGGVRSALDVGDLVAIEADGRRTVFCNVARARRVRALAQALVRQATATPYLRESQGLDRQVGDALAALQRR